MGEMLVKLIVTLLKENLTFIRMVMQAVLYFSRQWENGKLNYAQTKDLMYVKDLQVNFGTDYVFFFQYLIAYLFVINSYCYFTFIVAKCLNIFILLHFIEHLFFILSRILKLCKRVLYNADWQ